MDGETIVLNQDHLTGRLHRTAAARNHHHKASAPQGPSIFLIRNDHLTALGGLRVIIPQMLLEMI